MLYTFVSRCLHRGDYQGSDRRIVMFNSSVIESRDKGNACDAYYTSPRSKRRRPSALPLECGSYFDQTPRVPDSRRSFGHCVVEAIPDATHQGARCKLLAAPTESDRGVFAAVVGVVNHTARPALRVGPLESCQHELALQAIAHRPPDNQTREHIEHHRQIQKALARSGILRPVRCSFANCSRNSGVYRFAVFDLAIKDSSNANFKESVKAGPHQSIAGRRSTIYYSR